MRILVANRGEIARRIMATCRRLGHRTVAVYADPDLAAPHVHDADDAVRIGPGELAASYLSIDAIVAAAEVSGAEAVHPGYGFLAENTAFARAVIDAGLTWIGPRPEVIAQMGSKVEARRLAQAAGVATIPGFDGSQDPDDIAGAATELGYPVLLKASAGGGGRGIRIVHDPAELQGALREAAAEAHRTFGDDTMIVERYIQRPRHVEVQIVGDRHGALVHLGTRECSVQRRFQKLLEEAPAPGLSAATEAALCDAGVRLGASIGYDSAGTVEFVLDDDTGEFYFLEVNTRLQVEHPVTEAVTGLDLVALQIAVATGGHLGLDQDAVTMSGHAFEARITAEDVAEGFRPAAGTIRRLVVPDDVRWDAAVEEGVEVTPFYDPMIAKLVVSGSDRPTALRRLARGLDALLIAGVPTTAALHRWLTDQEPIVTGSVTTRFLDEADLGSVTADDVVDTACRAAATAWIAAARDTAADARDPWRALGSFRVTPHRPERVVGLRSGPDADVVEVPVAELDPAASLEATTLRWIDGGVTRTTTAVVDAGEGRVAVTVAATTVDFEIVEREERWSASAQHSRHAAGAVTAPFPAVVAEVAVAPGDQVDDGSVLVVIEAMKMLHSLTASGSGVVAEVAVAPGDQVESGQTLITLHSPSSTTEDPSTTEGP